MKALGEQGLDVLVDEIKKRTDGLDGKNGSVVDELDEVLKFAYKVHEKIGIGNIFQGENVYFAIADNFCKQLKLKLYCNYDSISYDTSGNTSYFYTSVEEAIADVHNYLKRNAPDGPWRNIDENGWIDRAHDGLFYTNTSTNGDMIYFSIFDI